ncbi:MAG: class I SAM-dependent methyltransferase [Vulcanimicrobiaceae bacterium]
MAPQYSEQHKLVQEKFSQQAVHWGQLAVSDDLREILERVEVPPDARVLDVAAGSGLLSRALARRAKEVVAVDITPEMLDRGREAAQREGIGNVFFTEGAAEALPFEDGSFDLVVTRFSLHHIDDPQRVVNEMVRVARGRGRVLLIDMLVPEDDPDLAERANAIERRRDPSHAWTPTFPQLQAYPMAAGATLVEAYTRERTRDLDDWIKMSGSEIRDELRAAFEAELSGGPPTGLAPYRENGAIRFQHPLGIVLAQA